VLVLEWGAEATLDESWKHVNAALRARLDDAIARTRLDCDDRSAGAA
jgi:hypothetical protein